MGAFGGDFDAPLENLVEVTVGIPYLMTSPVASTGTAATRAEPVGSGASARRLLGRGLSRWIERRQR